MSNTDIEQKPLKLTNSSKIHTLYAEIENNKLHLSPNLKFKHLGGGWDAIQFICTWQRKNNKVSIILLKTVKIDNLDFQDEVLLTAFYLADEILYENSDIRKDLLIRFIPFVENMNSPTLSKFLKNIRPRKVDFLCMGGVKNEYLKLFYNSDKSLKSKTDIENLVGNIFNTHLKRKNYDLKLDAIKEIVYEAVSNSDKHGHRDIYQNVIPKNVRALSINLTSFSVQDKSSFIGQQKHYDDFLRNVTEVLVISIFDSGEGIVKKYIETTSSKKEADLDFEERKNTLQEVFLAGVTSSQTPNSGMGLTYIKDRIKELKGLLSIRTSSLELFFTPTQGGEYQDHLNEASPCIGTLITVLIPIRFNGDADV